MFGYYSKAASRAGNPLFLYQGEDGSRIVVSLTSQLPLNEVQKVYRWKDLECVGKVTRFIDYVGEKIPVKDI